MLKLDDSLIVGKGANRICYRHPAEQSKCVKIIKAGGDRAQRLECKYYSRLIAENINWQYISQFYGMTETNLGDGYVYELIRDFDGSVSLSLVNYLNTEDTNKENVRAILKSLDDLKKFLIDHKILVRNLRPYNIVFKRTDSDHGHSVLIDNIGHHNDYFHLSDYIALLARRDTRKKWKKFESRINSLCVQSP